MDETVQIAGRWNYESFLEPIQYGETESYRLAAAWLNGCSEVEDWGCGCAFAKRFFTTQYIGIDGSKSLWNDKVADLMIYRSKTAPKRSQLIQSPFLSQMADIADRIEKISYDDWESERDDIVSELESLRDECQEKFDNIPEQLQEANAGSLLSERVENLDGMIDELGAIDIEEVEEDSIREEVESEFKKSEEETEVEFQERIKVEVDDRMEAKKEEVLDELHQISYQGG